MAKKYTNNQTIIEEDSISYLKQYLRISSRISTTYINEGDKFPSYDGEILLYKDENREKTGLRRIHVQVKGTAVEKFSNDKKSFQISRDDLNNYKNNGGVLFFIIELINEDKGKIFYIDLYPGKINKILEEKTANRPTLKAEHFDFTEENEAIEFLVNFHHETNYQNPYTKILDEIEAGVEMHGVMNVSLKSTDNIVEKIDEYLLNNKIYMHPIPNKNTREFENFVHETTFDEIERVVLNKISVNGKIYFDEYKVKKSKNENLIIFNSGITFNITKLKFDFKDTGTLNQRINNYNFMFDMINYQNLELNGKIFVSGFKKSINLSQAKEAYNYLKLIKDFLLFFGIKEDLNLENLLEDDFERLFFLIDILFNDAKKTIDDIGVGFRNIKLDNINIVLFFTKDGGNNIVVHDIFSNEFNSSILSIKDIENDIRYDKISLYVAMDEEILVNASNINFDRIMKDFENINIDKDIEYSYINSFALRLLLAYDKVNNQEILDNAIQLFNILLDSNISKELSIINLYQCYYRKRRLKDKELEVLSEIRDSASHNRDFSTLWACSVLLSNKTDIKRYFNKLDEERQKEIKSYPIFNLV